MSGVVFIQTFGSAHFVDDGQRGLGGGGVGIVVATIDIR